MGIRVGSRSCKRDKAQAETWCEDGSLRDWLNGTVREHVARTADPGSWKAKTGGRYQGRHESRGNL